MASVGLIMTMFASLVPLATSYNTNRRAEDDLEGGENNVNRWFIVFEDIVNENSSDTQGRTLSPTEIPNEMVTDPDPLSVVWYLGAFGGLIAFFLVVTFSEWCCASKHLYRRHALSSPYLTGYSSENRAPETPPPPYHLFAPPPYAEVICCDKSLTSPIYIIPVHQPPTISSPPPPLYSTIVPTNI